MLEGPESGQGDEGDEEEPDGRPEESIDPGPVGRDSPDEGAADLAEGQRRRVVVGTVPVLLSRLQGRVYAIGATCPHLGGPLDQGRVSDLTVTCPWHYSQFRLTDGQVLAGPATASALRFETRERDGQIEIRQAEESCQP